MVSVQGWCWGWRPVLNCSSGWCSEAEAGWGCGSCMRTDWLIEIQFISLVFWETIGLDSQVELTVLPWTKKRVKHSMRTVRQNERRGGVLSFQFDRGLTQQKFTGMVVLSWGESLVCLGADTFLVEHGIVMVLWLLYLADTPSMLSRSILISDET